MRWAYTVQSGLDGLGQGQNSFEEVMNSCCLGEQAYSHQKRFMLIAHRSQPPPLLPNTPSICTQFPTWLASLLTSQQPGLPFHSRHWVIPSTICGSASTFSGFPSSSTRQTHLGATIVRSNKARINCSFADMLVARLEQYYTCVRVVDNSKPMSIQKYLEKLHRLQLLTKTEVQHLCRTVSAIFLQEPNVLEVTGEQYVIGDIHGQYHDLHNLLTNIIPHMGTASYVFLGDYVDRGYNSVETICLLLCYKCIYPKSIVLIRGNHETPSLTKIYGFYDEVLKKYGNSDPWKAITQVFQYLPLAAVIQERILCLHGGLSPNIPFIDSIGLINRVREIPESGPMSDLVWSDPDSTLTTWAISNRGAGYLFPHAAVNQFKHINNIQTVARAHQLVEEGYVYNFGDESLVTVWSAPNYCYRCGNEASVMKVGEDGSKQFIKFGPSDETVKHNISYEHILPYFL